MSRPGSPRVVLWFRRDLRLHDNPLFAHEAARGAGELRACCVLDPAELGRPCPFTAQARVGPHRRRFLQEALSELAAGLRGLADGGLAVLRGPSDAELARFAPGGCVVLAADEGACPEEAAEQRRVGAALAAAGSRLELVPGNSLFRHGELSGGVPDDFGAWHSGAGAALQSLLARCAPAPSPPQRRPPPPEEPAAAAGDAVAPDEAAAPPPPARDAAARGGEAPARRRMEAWLAGGGQAYKRTFRHLHGDYSSRLGAALAFGCLSVRELALAASRALPPGQHRDHFLYELCWREFFRLQAAKHGPRLFAQGGPLRVRRGWLRDAEIEERWRQGRTGFPLVDAAMRELRETGYCGNLARQYVAAFLVDDLGIDWRVGAAHYEVWLTDYDPHTNWGQWGRSAGVFPATEAKRGRVSARRYLDLALRLPDRQAERYVERWIPELRGHPAPLAPWLAGPPPQGYCALLPAAAGAAEYVAGARAPRPQQPGRGGYRGRGRGSRQ